MAPKQRKQARHATKAGKRRHLSNASKQGIKAKGASKEAKGAKAATQSIKECKQISKTRRHPGFAN